MVTETQSEQDTSKTEPRTPLTRQRVLQAAVDLADRDGIDALSMRKLGGELGVEAMSLYNHVKNKEDILDGMVELVVREVSTDLPPEGTDWKTAMRDRILKARSVMLSHKWAPNVMESRTTVGPAVMIYINAILGIFKMGGFSYDLAHHALHALGSRTMGFSQELFEPDDGEVADADTKAMVADMAEHIPYVIGMMTEIAHVDGPDQTIGWCDDQTEFIFSIDLVLDGLERLRTAEG